MFSEKINNFFNSNNNDLKIIKNSYISNFNLSEFEPKSLNLTEKFRSKIKNLKTEKSEINDELNLYKKKNKTLILEKEEQDLIIKKLTKENEGLNNQIKNLKNFENKCYHQNNMIDKLKCQIETLNVDIKYKENIINNLQQILEQIKIKSNLISNNNITNDTDNNKFITNKNINNLNNVNNVNNKKINSKELGNELNNNGENNISDFLLDINSESIEKDIILPINLKVNSIDESINLDDAKKRENDSVIISKKEATENSIFKLKKNLKVKTNNNTTSKKNVIIFNENEEPETITKEMEKIDQDILNLKSKLKKIITK